MRKLTDLSTSDLENKRERIDLLINALGKAIYYYETVQMATGKAVDVIANRKRSSARSNLIRTRKKISKILDERKRLERKPRINKVAYAPAMRWGQQ